MILLAILHAAALAIWVYLLAKSGNLPPAALPGLKKFKKFSVTYDFDQVPLASPKGPFVVPSAPFREFGPAKRNRSVQNLAAAEAQLNA